MYWHRGTEHRDSDIWSKSKGPDDVVICVFAY